MDVFQATTNPSNLGSGTGSITGTYDNATNFLSYNIVFSGLSGSVTVMHFHEGTAGNTGLPTITISDETSPSIGTATLNSTQEGQLLNDGLYVNIHTTAFGGGEIRGQVLTTLVPEPTTPLFAILGLGAFLVRRVRGA